MVYSRLFLPTVASNVVLATVAMWGFMTEEDMYVRIFFCCHRSRR